MSTREISMTASSLEQKPPVGDGRRAVVPSSMTSDGPTYGYAAANIAGGLLFVSGQLGFDENDALPTDPAEQGGHALRRLGVVLAEAGCDYGDVAELRTYHVGNLAETNEWLLPAKSALF